MIAKWHFHVFPTLRNYLQPATESFVLKFKSTLQSVFYTRALAILIVHKAPNSFYYYTLPLRYWVLHISLTIPVNISTKSPMNLVCIMLMYYRCFNYSFAVVLWFLCWCSFLFILYLYACWADKDTTNECDAYLSYSFKKTTRPTNNLQRKFANSLSIYSFNAKSMFESASSKIN